MTASTKKKTLVLLDSHAILHRAFHALPSFTSPKGEPTGALYGFTSMLLKIIKDLKPDYLVACYDLPEPTFRHEFYEKYKAQRPKMDNELIPQIGNSKKILETFGIPFYEKAGFEADDVLATIIEQLHNKKGLKIIIITGDLDTLQLVRPGVEVYTLRKGMQDTVIYDQKAVKERYGFQPKLVPDFKGLMGDSSDNIIGVVGIGEKTAKDLIGNFGSLEDLYKKLEKGEKLFEKKGIKPRVIKLLKENKNEAFFSKSLAETRADVPISFSLTDSEWRPPTDNKKMQSLFREFGFRRFSRQFSTQTAEVEPPLGGSTSETLEKELKLAFWLLDSRRINSSLDDVFEYTGARNPAEAQKWLEKELKKQKLWKLFDEVERPLIPILSGMETKGVLLDIACLKALSKDYHKKLEALETEIWQMAGQKFNISSPKQLSEILFEKMKISSRGLRRTGTGALSTRFSELEKIKSFHPIIEKIFSYRELAKLTSTYIDNLPQVVGKDGRLHTSFNQTGTSTGRLSSSDPNLQNIPVKSPFGAAVRRAFVAPDGWKIVSFDYSQIELRIAAFLSGDKKLKEAFKRGEDIHSRVASEVFNVPFDKVTAEMRRRAKIINFGIIYGMGINSLKKNLGCSRENAESFYAEYFNDFAGMADYIESVKRETARKGFTETLFKRRRYLPEINSPLDFIRKEAERMAVNAPIQGTAADIIKIAMVKLDGFLRERNLFDKARLLLQVHDELVFEIKDDIMYKAVPIIKQAMEEKRLPDIPLEATYNIWNQKLLN